MNYEIDLWLFFFLDSVTLSCFGFKTKEKKINSMAQDREKNHTYKPIGLTQATD